MDNQDHDDLSRFPNEIISLIFECIFEPPEAEDTRMSHYHPLPLSHVSRRWRQVAISTSSLWRFIYFEFYDPIGKVEAYLERSKTHPLHIIINLDTKILMEDDDMFLDHFRAIISHVHRWKDFAIFLSVYRAQLYRANTHSSHRHGLSESC